MEKIVTKKQLKEFLDDELGKIKKNCNPFILHCPYVIYEEQVKYVFIKLLRKAEYHTNTKHLIRGFLYRNRLFHYEVKHKMFIPMNRIDKGLNIAHIGNIIINDHVRIGKNLKIYPGVIIGNNEFKDHIKCPIIGDNVYIGAGSKIIGDIKISNNCIIAANSIVSKSITEDNLIVGGIPAKTIKKNNYKMN